PVRFLVNTHYHGDHTGGNENFGKAGVIIVAHENVRKRLKTKPSPKVALPVVTFADEVTFHWNGDEIHVFHVEPAHTDGDSIVHFTQANVIHMGDTYFNSLYPYIDVASGGNIDGMIAAADVVLKTANNSTKIIPGHGSLSNKKELQEYREMLVTMRDRIQKLIDQGKNKDQVIAAKPTQDHDAKWGNGFMDPTKWVGIVYDGLVKNPKQ
ncbi:MAG: MBL fold metallo-hydrolase, partial [Planctomycetota bacterium]